MGHYLNLALACLGKHFQINLLDYIWFFGRYESFSVHSIRIRENWVFRPFLNRSLPCGNTLCTVQPRKSSTPSNDDRKFFVKSVLTACPFALQAILAKNYSATRYNLMNEFTNSELYK